VVIASPFIWIHSNWGDNACFLISLGVVILLIHSHNEYSKIDNKHYGIDDDEDGSISDEEWAEYDEWAESEEKVDVIEAPKVGIP
jgi:hypothetical protein